MKVYYPSFYRAVHRAWNSEGPPDFLCYGDEEQYEPDEHACFTLAGNVRVELHAAGIRLNVEEASPRRLYVSQLPKANPPPVQIYGAESGKSIVVPGLDGATFRFDPEPAAGDGFWERPALDREEPALD